MVALRERSNLLVIDTEACFGQKSTRLAQNDMELTFSNFHFDGFQFAAAQNVNWDGFADHITAQADEQVILMGNRFACHADENITDHHTAFSSRAVGFETDQQKPAILFAL